MIPFVTNKTVNGKQPTMTWLGLGFCDLMAGLDQKVFGPTC